jgi:hypothetical protein
MTRAAAMYFPFGKVAGAASSEESMPGPTSSDGSETRAGEAPPVSAIAGSGLGRELMDVGATGRDRPFEDVRLDKGSLRYCINAASV